MKISLSEHFTYGKLFRFVLPSVIMMVFTSIYGVVDGLFVSNFVGKTAFAAVNLIMPLLMGISSVGFMIGTGGCALVTKTLGEGQHEKAEKYFSMLIYATVISGIIISIITHIVLVPVLKLMGATESLMNDCVIYGRILITFQTAFMLQNVFQSFFAAAEKPRLGLLMTVAAGMTNIVLDALFVGVFRWGVAGAAAATVMSQIVGGVVPLFYFARKNSSLLRIVKPEFHGKMLLKACANGSSEMLTSISSSLVSTLYNLHLMELAGENGVAAYGVLMYVNFIYVAIFIGYAIGSAPIVGYNYGAANYKELKNMLRKSLITISVTGLVLTTAAELLAAPMTTLFVGYDRELFELTKNGFRLYSFCFLINGFNIFGSSFFTALNNGAVSAAISFMRTLVFQIIVISIMPALFGINGIWISVTAAELLSLAVTLIFLITNRKKYNYA